MNQILTTTDLIDPNKNNKLSELEAENLRLQRLVGEVDRLRRETEAMRATQRVGLHWEKGGLEEEKLGVELSIIPRLILEENGQPISKLSGNTGNLVIEGDNYDALRLLAKTHAGKIDCIYIDPPYNTGQTTFVYNDRFVGKDYRWRKSLWLDFLYRRLILARDLLSERGVILVSINDEHRSILELLMDEVMPGRRIGSFVWRCRTAGKSEWNFSDDHEHVLIYGNPKFRFGGVERAETDYTYKHPSGRLARTITLSGPKDYTERSNLFFPIYDTVQDCWFPCDPHRAWAYSADAIEDLKSRQEIHFPKPSKTAPVKVFATEGDFISAIKAGDVPHAGKGAGRRPVFTMDLIAQGAIDPKEWVGRRIAWGRPSKVDFLDEAKSATKVISSWMVTKDEERVLNDDQDDSFQLTSKMNAEATDDLTAIFGGKKVFNYAKPPSLLVSLIMQATNSSSLVLDFFAGSGTTAKAVLEANRSDGGNRRFIMISSTEATEENPDKNLCRDVCAQRIRAVCEGYKSGKAKIAGTGDGFAYVRLDRIETWDADLALEDPQIVWNLLQIKHDRPLTLLDQANVAVDANGDIPIIYCTAGTDAVLEYVRKTADRPSIVYTGFGPTMKAKLSDLPIETRDHFVIAQKLVNP